MKEDPAIREHREGAKSSPRGGSFALSIAAYGHAIRRRSRPRAGGRILSFPIRLGTSRVGVGVITI